MAQQYNGIYLPDREEYLKADIDVSLPFGGASTVQFKKFHRAFAEFKGFRHAIDIGANAGIWTRVMARCFARVTCFEPNPECHEAFWLNNPPEHSPPLAEVSLHPVALGQAPGYVTLNTKLRSTGFTKVDPQGDFVAEMRTLDSFDLEDVDFIKIDVEGWEHNVVKGAVETIRKWRPVMIVEQKPNNAESHGLKQFGAVRLLEKMGARRVADMAGDIIMAW